LSKKQGISHCENVVARFIVRFKKQLNVYRAKLWLPVIMQPS